MLTSWVLLVDSCDNFHLNFHITFVYRNRWGFSPYDHTPLIHLGFSENMGREVAQTITKSPCTISALTASGINGPIVKRPKIMFQVLKSGRVSKGQEGVV